MCRPYSLVGKVFQKKKMFIKTFFSLKPSAATECFISHTIRRSLLNVSSVCISVVPVYLSACLSFCLLMFVYVSSACLSASV